MDELTDYEKLVQSLVQMAVTVAQYHQSLIENNICDELAEKLTIEFQKSLLNLAKGNQ